MTTTIFDKNTLPSFASIAAASGTNKPIFGNADSVSASPIFKPISFGGSVQPPSTIKPLFGASSTVSKTTVAADEEGNEEGQEGYAFRFYYWLIKLVFF